MRMIEFVLYPDTLSVIHQIHICKFKLNIVKYFCRLNLVGDNPFQSIDQYISKISKRFYWILLKNLFTLIIGISGLKRDCNC